MLVHGFCNAFIVQNATAENSNKFSDNTHLAIAKADTLYRMQQYAEALQLYQSVLQQNNLESPPVLKKVALSYAAQNNAIKSVEYIEAYLLKEFNTDFLADDGFSTIDSSKEFIAVVAKYTPKFTTWNFLYLYVALIGFYITLTINFSKKIDKTARILISSFVFIHSFFILHICLNLANYHYEYPHTYLMSTSFSFLYGPLLYFYFKRITEQYTFKIRDLLHLIPTVLFLIYIIPIYSMSASDKLDLMLGRISKGYQSQDSEYVALLVVLKLASLIIYGYFVGKLYIKGKQRTELKKADKFWQRNVYSIHILYVISYAIYGVLISNHMKSGFFYHSQLAVMSFMVLYIGHTATVRPRVFQGIFSWDAKTLFKYKKSGLTQSLSVELKESLINLFDHTKIYKENNISLELLAEKLGTTRHNASQVINEHFQMGFHDLINKYRIDEAKKIMASDYQKNLNIIDIAYEVGYNNKVTFNKAFKKDTQLTPSQYQRIAIHA